MKNFNLKNENAITLIALIITIIILVILAAVSIRAVYEMGIVGHAINGTQQYARAAVEENEMMGQTTQTIENAVAKLKEIQRRKQSKHRSTRFTKRLCIRRRSKWRKTRKKFI